MIIAKPQPSRRFLLLRSLGGSHVSGITCASAAVNVHCHLHNCNCPLNLVAPAGLYVLQGCGRCRGKGVAMAMGVGEEAPAPASAPASAPALAPQRKLKLLGLHGFRTNGAILKHQLAKWGPALNDLFHVDCPDAPLPCSGKSEVEGLFEGPYYEWFRCNKDYTEFYHVDEKLYSYITTYMKQHGPYDGFIGFSQGATLAGCLGALQEKGLAFQDVPRLRCLVLVSPAQLRAQHLKHIYQEPTIKCPTLAFLGEKDRMLLPGIEVLKSFENKVIINHRSGHTIPRLDEEQTATAMQFFKSQLAAIDASDVAGKGPDAATSDKVADVEPLSYTSMPSDSHNAEVSVGA